MAGYRLPLVRQRTHKSQKQRSALKEVKSQTKRTHQKTNPFFFGISYLQR